MSTARKRDLDDRRTERYQPVHEPPRGPAPPDGGARRPDSWIPGVRTTLVREALSAAMTERAREQVLFSAGWDVERDRPRDPRLDPLQWVDTKLYGRLAESTSLGDAAELAAQVKRLLSLVERGRPEDDMVANEHTAIRQSGPVRKGKVTRQPLRAGRTVLVWTELSEIELIVAFARTDLEVIAVRTPAELAAMLTLPQSQSSVVVLDARKRDHGELFELARVDLGDRQIVRFGDSALVSHIVRGTGVQTSCASEAELTDLADLCASLLAAPRL